MMKEIHTISGVTMECKILTMVRTQPMAAIIRLTVALLAAMRIRVTEVMKVR